MTVKLLAPLIGEGVEGLGAAAWKKKLGDTVIEREALVELESDKVATEGRRVTEEDILAFDRRDLDGEAGDSFLRTGKETLESWA